MDEMQRRKQLRQQQKSQKAQRQRLITRLVIAGVALVAVAIVLLVVSCQPNEEPTVTQPTGTLAADSAPTQAATQATGTTVVRITALGDLNATEKTVASGGAGYDYSNTFLDVVPVLAEADLTLLNLEGILCGAPYGTEDRSAPHTMMTALASAGVDLVQTANSYTIKNGVAGLSLTLSSLEAAGLTSVGAYARDEDYERTGGYTLCTVNGVKIAFVALTKGMDGMALPAGNEKCVNLLYSDYSSTYKSVNTEGIEDVLSRAAAADPDVIIALVHWGSAYNDTHNDSQLKIRDLLLANGVDAIIGTHPHYVQQVSFDPAAGTVVAYSLGDFFSDATRSGTEYSIALHLEITKDNVTGETAITGCDYTPLFTATDEEGILRVVRLEPAIRAYEEGYVDKVTDAVYNSMLYARERIKSRVENGI